MNGILLVGFLLSITSIFTLIFGTNAFAQTFGTIKNEKYCIQFQVPIDWTVTEKQSRFDEGADITVRSPEPLGGVFTITYDDAITLVGSENIQEATDAMLPTLKNSFYRYDVKTVEQPHLITIGNKTAGTAVFAVKEKYEDTPTTLASQIWIVIDGSKAYMIMYMDSPSKFDSEKNTMIRDIFIKSIRFLDMAETESSSNTTSRFDF